MKARKPIRSQGSGGFSVRHGPRRRLNPTAHFVWAHCDGQLSTRQIDARMRRHLTGPNGLKADLETILDELEKRQLIEYPE